MADGTPPTIVRGEFEHDDLNAANVVDVERKLSITERIAAISSVRKLSILVALLIVWELYTRLANVSEYMMPTFSATGTAFYAAIVDEGMLLMVQHSIKCCSWVM